jgi:SAM-dependent methyltransferase
MRTLVKAAVMAPQRAYARLSPTAARYRRAQRPNLQRFRAAFPNVPILEEIIDRHEASSAHPQELAQFLFASNELYGLKPSSILDIGSHSPWIFGVASAYPLKMLDIRARALVPDAVQLVVGSAEQLPFPDASESCVTSLCSLEHFGLGSYGDPIDPGADVKAVQEIARVLLRGGSFVFSTNVTRRRSYIVFNTNRVYSIDDLHAMLSRSFVLVRERFFSMRLLEFIDEREVSDQLGTRTHDLYMGHWRRR